MMKISVLTIVRNGMPFVEQTINSVIGQTYQNLEYIVIDGGSTDGTVDVIRSHESGITRWLSEKDEGIADAFNKGLSLATGDYLLYLSSDDALAGPDVLAIMAEKVAENGSPPLIYGDCDVLDRTTGQVRYRTHIEFSPGGLGRGQMLPHPSMLAHRSYFDKYGAFDTRFAVAMDYEWLLRGGLKERIVHVPVLVTNVRDGGVSAQNRRIAVNEIIAALRKHGHLPHVWSEWKMRGYFLAREIAKAMLKVVGAYKVYSDIRSRNR